MVDGIELERLRQLRHGRRDQRRQRAAAPGARSSCGRSTATGTARRPTSSPATSGASWACRSKAASSTPTASRIVIANERGLDRQQGRRRLPQLHVQARTTAPTDRLSVFVRGGYFREERDNAKVTTTVRSRHEVEVRSSGGVRVTLPDDSDLQARSSSTTNTFHSNFLAVTAPSAAVPARRIVRPDDAAQEVPTTGVGAMVQWSKALGAQHFFSAGADWRRVDGDSLEQAYSHAVRRSCRRRLTRRSRCAATPAARSTAAAPSCRTVFSLTPSCRSRSARASTTGATTTATTSRPRWPPACRRRQSR